MFSMYIVGLFLWAVTFIAAAVCQYWGGGQEKKMHEKKARPLRLDILEV